MGCSSAVVVMLFLIVRKEEDQDKVHIAVELEAEERNTYIYFPSADDADSITERLIRTKLDKIACIASF
nr:hypothetical protein Iba_chr11bCG9950 [Ipomoea batatas]